MKGEIAMLYTGDTLAEAFSKALGRPIGQKAKVFGTSGSKPDEFGKHQDALSGPALQDYLRPLRDEAILRAQRWLSFNYDPELQEEIGYFEMYNRHTQRRLLRSGVGAGTPRSGSRPCEFHFDFNFPVALGWEILVTGHSHPDCTSPGSVGLGGNNAERLVGDDRNLYRYGPVVIATPNMPGGRVFDGRRRYETFDHATRKTD